MSMKLGLTLKGGHGLKVFMNSMLRKTFGLDKGINRTRKNCMRSFMIVLLNKYYSNEHINEDEICGVCRPYGR